MDNRSFTRANGKVIGQEIKPTKTGKTMFKVKFLMPDGTEKVFWSWDDFQSYIGQSHDFDWWTEPSTQPGGKPFWKCQNPDIDRSSRKPSPSAPANTGFSFGGKGDEISAKLDTIISMLAKMSMEPSGTASVPALPSSDEKIPF